jgi:polar amino acid transport system substrate-binding protein
MRRIKRHRLRRLPTGNASEVATEQSTFPRQWLARAITLLWIFTGVVFVAATLTVRQVRGPINGPEDLPGKAVGTIKGTVSARYLREHNATVVELQHVEDMYHALLDKKVDALLLGAPVLRYYATREGKGLVKMDPEFAKGGLGLAFQEGSPLRREVNHALTAMREDGTYQRIYEKWFGSEVQGNNR